MKLASFTVYLHFFYYVTHLSGFFASSTCMELV
jgi:hypothetical protein